jgi:hypothetical protein
MFYLVLRAMTFVFYTAAVLIFLLGLRRILIDDWANGLSYLAYAVFLFVLDDFLPGQDFNRK